jgi:hypothetical protein
MTAKGPAMKGGAAKEEEYEPRRNTKAGFPPGFIFPLRAFVVHVLFSSAVRG